MHAQLVNALWSALRELGLKGEASYVDFLQIDVIRRLRGKERVSSDGERLRGRAAGGSVLLFSLARTRRDVGALEELLQKQRAQAEEQGHLHKRDFLQEALTLIAEARQSHETQELERKREHTITLTQEDLILLKTALQFYERHDRITQSRYTALRERLTPEQVKQ